MSNDVVGRSDQFVAAVTRQLDEDLVRAAYDSALVGCREEHLVCAHLVCFACDFCLYDLHCSLLWVFAVFALSDANINQI